AEPHSARAEHRVALLERALTLLLVLELLQLRLPAQARLRDALQELEAVREELVQRRVEQPDRDRPALHCREQPLEVLLLKRQQLVQGGPPARLVLRPDHPLHFWPGV